MRKTALGIPCGQCGSRLIICNSRNRHGKVYPYFVCSGRHGDASDCTRQAVLIEDVERLIESYYDRIQISGQTRQNVAGMMHAQFDQLMAADTQELARLAADRDRLDNERVKALVTRAVITDKSGRVLADYGPDGSVAVDATAPERAHGDAAAEAAAIFGG